MSSDTFTNDMRALASWMINGGKTPCPTSGLIHTLRHQDLMPPVSLFSEGMAVAGMYLLLIAEATDQGDLNVQP